MFFKSNSNTNIPFLISSLFFLVFSIYQINLENLWFDELMTLWITNPELSNDDTFNKVIEHENTPPLYYFIVKFFFQIFGYNYELLRIPNVLFHFFSLFIFFLIIKKISTEIIFIYLALLLFSLNYFLISYVQEGRVYIFFCFTSLLFLNIYLSILVKDNQINKFDILSLFLASLILINTFIFSFIILGTIFLYEFFFKKKNKKYFWINFALFLSIIISGIVNFEFYKSILQFKAVSITNPDIKFYLFNFFFKQYFGSKIMGYLFFLLFLFSIFFLLKKGKIKGHLLFLFFIIFFSYLIPILYGYLFNPVLQDKYIIYIIPLILIFISYSISQINSSKMQIYIFFFLIILSIANQSLKIFKKEIDKPQFVQILKEIKNQSKSNIYIASFMDHKNELYNRLVDNYVSQIVRYNSLGLKDKIPGDNKFWVICYDPSNTYQYCIEKNALSINTSNEIRFYQTIAFLKYDN